MTDEELVKKFDRLVARIVGDEADGADIQELKVLTERNKIRLKEIVPAYDDKCRLVSNWLVDAIEKKLRAISERIDLEHYYKRINAGGYCGCRGCEELKARRERLLNPESDRDKYGYN